ncbi:hypothetical protein M0R72_06950 [Candidatus Pacearchaeota archaeon]|jgi:hypothetical protein|nr:hypothetical protein [Candidatus Pacearchaeota archaeon]
MVLGEKIWGNAIGAFVQYGYTAAKAALKPLLVTDNGDGTGTLVVSTASSALPTGAATSAKQDTQITAEQAILAKLIAAPATEAKQDTGNASLSSIKTAVEGATPAGTVTMDSITLTLANTEYSKALPANCKTLTFRCVDSTKINAGSDIRYAFETDKVHDSTLPFMLLDGGSVYSESNLLLTSETLYVAGITAGDIVLLEMWT